MRQGDGMETRNASEDRSERRSTTWAEIEAVVDDGGYRAGFVRVFLEFQGAILDDEPLDAKARPAVVNQSNFARHFGIAISTFHRWLGEFAPGEGFGPREPAKAAAAKERQKTKAKKKNLDAEQADVRRRVASERKDFAEKCAVRRCDSNLWFIDLHCLLEWEPPTAAEKAAAMDEVLAVLDEEAEALDRFRETLLEERTRLGVDGFAEGAA